MDVIIPTKRADLITIDDLKLVQVEPGERILVTGNKREYEKVHRLLKRREWCYMTWECVRWKDPLMYIFTRTT